MSVPCSFTNVAVEDCIFMLNLVAKDLETNKFASLAAVGHFDFHASVVLIQHAVPSGDSLSISKGRLGLVPFFSPWWIPLFPTVVVGSNCVIVLM